MKRLLIIFFCFLAIWDLGAQPTGKVLKTSGNSFLPGDLVLYDLATRTEVALVSGGDVFGPCFSPDGQKIAFAESGTIYTINTDGSNKTAITSCAGSNMQLCMSWTNDDYIYWSETDTNIYRTGIASRTKTIVHTSTEKLYMVSVSLDGQRAACSKEGWNAWCIEIGGAEYNMGAGCQGTVSPDGNYITHNLPSHTSAYIQNFGQASQIIATITPPYGYFHQHRFSHSSNDWVVFTANENEAFICDWRNNRPYRVGNGAAWDYFPSVQGIIRTMPPATISIERDYQQEWLNLNGVKIPELGNVQAGVYILKIKEKRGITLKKITIIQ